MACWGEVTAMMRPILAACLAVAVLTACSSALPASPAKMERCSKLYAAWLRYGQHTTFHHTGQRARAELAVEDCRAARYDQGMAELEELLRRNRLPIPRPSSRAPVSLPPVDGTILP
jgi:hypothetical protein